jgi:NhaA family Na+:H+ antiporter
MQISQSPLSTTFMRFFDSEKSGGILILAFTLLSLAIANSPIGEDYIHFWHFHIFGLSIEHWVNDGLMAIFFLFIGLELERELYSGELSDFRKALQEA